MIITVDGLACSGKGTIARAFASQHNFMHLDAGLIFRSAAYTLRKKMVDDLTKLSQLTESGELAYKWSNNQGLIILGGRNITVSLSDPKIAEFTSVLCATPGNMIQLTNLVRSFAKVAQKVITDGRNTGSTIFPEADHKFVLQAKPKIRAQRRYEDLCKTIPEITLKEVQKQIRVRDNRDRNRPFAAFKVPNDAAVINTSKMTASQCLELMTNIIFKKYPRV